MCLPQKGLQGGPPGHLPFLVEGLRNSGSIVVETVYGARKVNSNSLKRILSLIKSIREIRKQLKNNDFDVIQINTAFDKKALLRDFFVLLSIRSFTVKHFLKFHGSELNLLKTNNPIYKYMINKLFNWVDGLGLLSSEEVKGFRNYGVPAYKLHIVKNILVTSSCLKDPSFRLKYNIKGETPIILFIARFIHSKGLLDVISALNIIHNQNIDFYLFCVGNGPELNKAHKLVKNLNLCEKVFFTNYIPEAETKIFYNNSDILVFPTCHDEGFPMVVFRSLAAGLPIITTRIRASADYLIEPEHCLWVQPRNPQELAEKIRILLHNSDLCNKMRINNIILSKQFSEKIVCGEFENIYRKIIKS